MRGDSSSWSTIPHSRTPPPLQSNIEKVGDIVRPSSATAHLSSSSSAHVPEAGSTSWASTPTTTTLPPIDEADDGTVVKSSIAVDTARLTPAVFDGGGGKEDRRDEEGGADCPKLDDPPTVDESSQPGSSREQRDTVEKEENGPSQDGILPSTSSAQEPSEMTTSGRNPLRKLRYTLRLPAKAAQRLKRIANFQPGSLRRIGLSALRISDGDLIRLADGPPPRIPTDHEIGPSTSYDPRDPREQPPSQVPINMLQPPPPMVAHQHFMIKQEFPHPGMRQMTAEEFAHLRAREANFVMVKQEPLSSHPTPIPGTPTQLTPAPPSGIPVNPQQQRIQQQQTPNASNSPLLVNLLSNQNQSQQIQQQGPPPQQVQQVQPPGGQGQQQQFMGQFQGQQQQLSMQQIAAIQQQQQQQQYQQRMMQQQQQQQAMMQQHPPTTPTPGQLQQQQQQQPPPGYFPGQQPPGTPGRPPFPMAQPPMYQGGPQVVQRIPSYPGGAPPQPGAPPQQHPQQQFRPQPEQQIIAEPPKKKKRPTKKQKEAALAAEQQQQQQQMNAFYGQQQQQQERMQMMQQQQQGQMMGGGPQYPPGYPGMPPPQQAQFPYPGATPQQQQMWHHQHQLQQQQQQQQRMAMFQQQQAQAQGQWQGQGQPQRLPVAYPPGTNPDVPNPPPPQGAPQHRMSGEFAPPPGAPGAPGGQGAPGEYHNAQRATPQGTPQPPGAPFHRSDSSASFGSVQNPQFAQQAPTPQPPAQGPAGQVPGGVQQQPAAPGAPGPSGTPHGDESAVVERFLTSSEPLADLGDLGDLGDLELDPMMNEMQEGRAPSTSNGDRNERLAASIELIVDEVARSGRAGAHSAELAAVGERRGSHSIQLPSASPGGTPCITGNLSHEHNMRAHAFHGNNRTEQPNGMMRMLNGEGGGGGVKTNGARRQPVHGTQQVKVDDETNDAKIAEFAKTISEKDKKIKAAAENKTKAKGTRKPRTTKKTVVAGLPPGHGPQMVGGHPNAPNGPMMGGHLQMQHMQQQQSHQMSQMMMHQRQHEMAMHNQMPLHHLPTPPTSHQQPQS